MGCARHHFVSIICLISFNPQKVPWNKCSLYPDLEKRILTWIGKVLFIRSQNFYILEPAHKPRHCDPKASLFHHYFYLFLFNSPLFFFNFHGINQQYLAPTLLRAFRIFYFITHKPCFNYHTCSCLFCIFKSHLWVFFQARKNWTDDTKCLQIL